ncbi:MAG: L-threonylcarbamoyladenylate synthase [Patescibacteria group bacterium]
MEKSYREAVRRITQGEVGIIPTDTLYGVVCDARNAKAVQKIYTIRKRDPQKPCIILIGEASQIKQFGINVDGKTTTILKKVWPGKVSVVLPCPLKKFQYLHRGTNSLAFRLPKNKKLAEFLKKTGPLVAPSANLEGTPPATTISEARQYFGSHVDFYITAGRKQSLASTVVAIQDGKIRIIREGAKKL